MRRILKQIAKKILTIPIVEKEIKEICSFYEKPIIYNSAEEYLLKNLDIKENFTEEDAGSLTNLLKMFLKDGMKIVEIGSWKGCSTYFLAKAVLNRNGKVFAIDHWQGSKNSPNHAYTRYVNVFKIFQHNMAMLGVDKVISPIKIDSMIASKGFKNESIDFIFIDGDHVYESFKKDILAWFPKLKIGGVISGHDCEGYYEDYPPEIKEKIDNSLKEDFIPKLCHPGIIKGLHEFFGKEYKRMPKGFIWYYIKKHNL